MAKQTIRIACKGAATLDQSKLVEFQGNLKDLTKDNYQRLKKQIVELGFSEPFSVWKQGKSHNVLNGHQRLRTIREMIKEGWACPPVPVNMVEAKSLKEAKRKVLALASQYGNLNRQGLYEFIIENDFSPTDLMENFSFPEVDFPTFNVEFFDKPGGSGGGEGERVDYSKKIEAPIYEPKGECPVLEALVDVTKFEVLSSRVEKAKIPKPVKEFLLHAATRHIVFDYQEIAEYYAHADKKVQALMEESALVIIDFKKAIEYGFVKLSKNLAEAYKDNGATEKTEQLTA